MMKLFTCHSFEWFQWYMDILDYLSKHCHVIRNMFYLIWHVFDWHLQLQGNIHYNAVIFAVFWIKHSKHKSEKLKAILTLPEAIHLLG